MNGEGDALMDSFFSELLGLGTWRVWRLFGGLDEGDGRKEREREREREYE